MMARSDIEILSEMIHESAKVKPIRSHDRLKVILRDAQAGTEVSIFGLPDDAVVIDLDSHFSNDKIFAGTKGECRRADFIIAVKSDSTTKFVIIEVKRTNDETRHIVEQLIGGMCFARYCREIGRSFWRAQEFMSRTEFRFVAIKQISIDKRPTRAERVGKSHDEPGKMLKIYAPHHIEFNMLSA